jgi:hypothetical protein
MAIIKNNLTPNAYIPGNTRPSWGGTVFFGAQPAPKPLPTNIKHSIADYVNLLNSDVDSNGVSDKIDFGANGIFADGTNAQMMNIKALFPEIQSWGYPLGATTDPQQSQVHAYGFNAKNLTEAQLNANVLKLANAMVTAEKQESIKFGVPDMTASNPLTPYIAKGGPANLTEAKAMLGLIQDIYGIDTVELVDPSAVSTSVVPVGNAATYSIDTSSGSAALKSFTDNGIVLPDNLKAVFNTAKTPAEMTAALQQYETWAETSNPDPAGIVSSDVTFKLGTSSKVDGRLANLTNSSLDDIKNFFNAQFPGFTIPDNLANQFTNASTTAEKKAVYNALKAHIETNYPGAQFNANVQTTVVPVISQSGYALSDQLDLTVEDGKLYQINPDGSRGQLVRELDINDSRYNGLSPDNRWIEGTDKAKVTVTGNKLMVSDSDNPNDAVSEFNLDEIKADIAKDGAAFRHDPAGNNLAIVVPDGKGGYRAQIEHDGANIVRKNADGTLGETLRDGLNAVNDGDWISRFIANPDENKDKVMLFTDTEKAYQVDFSSGKPVVTVKKLSELPLNAHAQIFDTGITINDTPGESTGTEEIIDSASAEFSANKSTPGEISTQRLERKTTGGADGQLRFLGAIKAKNSPLVIDLDNNGDVASKNGKFDVNGDGIMEDVSNVANKEDGLLVMGNVNHKTGPNGLQVMGNTYDLNGDGIANDGLKDGYDALIGVINREFSPEKAKAMLADNKLDANELRALSNKGLGVWNNGAKKTFAQLGITEISLASRPGNPGVSPVSDVTIVDKKTGKANQHLMGDYWYDILPKQTQIVA